MEKKETIENKVMKILREKGEIDNFYCIDNRITIRLGAVIFKLKEAGEIELDERSGFIEGTKNWRYVVKPLQSKTTHFI